MRSPGILMLLQIPQLKYSLVRKHTKIKTESSLVRCCIKIYKNRLNKIFSERDYYYLQLLINSNIKSTWITIDSFTNKNDN